MLHSIVYLAPDLDTWSLAHTDPERLYRKELIYVGDFVNDDQHFHIDEALLLHWTAVHDALVAAGNEVPVPLEHTADPEKRRGSLKSLKVETDSQGRVGLFGYIKFRDAEAEKLISSGVSIYVPPEWTDGKGTRYVRPIRHVALTDYPVIPGLDQFQAIAASLSTGDSSMAMRDLAKLLNITVGDDDKDDAIQAKIVSEFKTLKAKPTPKPEIKPAPKPEEKPIAAGFITMARDNREMKLDALVADAKITPVVRDQLATQYCSDKALVLCLSLDSMTGEQLNTDGFDAVISALAENDPVKLNEQTKAQGVRMSHSTSPANGSNPLMEDAERRAKEAAAERG